VVDEVVGVAGIACGCAIGMAYINVTQTSEELGWAVMASWVSVRRDMSQGTYYCTCLPAGEEVLGCIPWCSLMASYDG